MHIITYCQSPTVQSNGQHYSMLLDKGKLWGSCLQWRGVGSEGVMWGVIGV